MKSKRSRAIIKSLHKEVNSYKAGNGKIEGKNRAFFLTKDENKVDRLLYKIKYQKSLLAAKKQGF